jgi:4-amino-4-deoxy-L-arabinose transferase-like glycosyltransferase
MEPRTLTKRTVSKIDWRNVPDSWWAVLIAAVFTAFALMLLFTKRPWVDEAWFTGPPLDLVTRGKFGTFLLDPAGSHLRLYKPDAFLRGINEHTYWVMPIHLLQLAAWGKLFGFSVFSMRMPSVLWGGVALASVGSIIRSLYGGRGAALIGAAVLAVDFGFVNGAADVRMDMTCTALGLAALAVYLGFREANFSGAVIGAHTLAAAAVFTHPNGIYSSAGLVLAMLWLDRHRVRPLTVALMAAPYALFGVLWGIYCLQAPEDFKAQFSANAAARASDAGAPWRGIWRELNGRFRNHFWPEDSRAGKIKIVGLVVYVAALTTLLSARKLREKDGCRLLLYLTLLQFLCLSLFSSFKATYYIIYILPYLAVATGIAASYLWSSYGTRVRVLCASALLSYLAVQTAAVTNLSMATSGYRKEYTPVVTYLKSILKPDDLVMGTSELGFSLGFENPQLVDDVWFGYWSVRRPTVLVVDRWYYAPVIEAAASRGMPKAGYYDTLFKSFHLIREMKGYRIYRR